MKNVRKPMVKEQRTFKHRKNRKKKEKWAKLPSLKQRKEPLQKQQKEKRTKVGKKKAKKAQRKVAIIKVGTQEEKEQTHPEMAAPQTEIVDTGISTGSKEKEQQEEKSPEILANEAADMLAALSTPAIQKGKRERQTSMYFKARKSTRFQTNRIGETVEGHG